MNQIFQKFRDKLLNDLGITDEQIFIPEEKMEITANLLKLQNEWIIAQVEPVEGDTLPGDPDVWMVEPYVVDCEGQIDSMGTTCC